MNMEVVRGILIPFLGTSLGAACIFFMRGRLNAMVQRALTGFAAGVMVAASVWSLLLPAIDQSAAMGSLAFLPAAAGFWLGVLFLLLLDKVVPHLHTGLDAASFSIPDVDAGYVIFITQSGNYVQFIFTPASDEGFASVAQLVTASIMPEDA